MKYFMYKINSDEWIKFENKDELISYFTKYNKNVWYLPQKTCSLLEEVNMNGKDLSIIMKSKTIYDEDNNYVCTHHWVEKRLKNIMVFDELNRIIDPRLFKKEILSETYDRSKLPKRKIDKSKKYNYSYIPYVYRCDPVPGIHKYKRNSYRKVRYRQMLVQITTKETNQFVRQKKYDLGFDMYWKEYPVKYRSKSWKNKKVRKQYMKNQKSL